MVRSHSVAVRSRRDCKGHRVSVSEPGRAGRTEGGGCSGGPGAVSCGARGRRGAAGGPGSLSPGDVGTKARALERIAAERTI